MGIMLNLSMYFFWGSEGTSKSRLVKVIYNFISEKLLYHWKDYEKPWVLLLGSTGISAVNISGTIIHDFLKKKILQKKCWRPQLHGFQTCLPQKFVSALIKKHMHQVSCFSPNLKYFSANRPHYHSGLEIKPGFKLISLHDKSK